MSIVAIHQPNFFPWLGYFDKISRADVLIFLDAVDYPRAGSGSMGSWCNRVRIDIQSCAQWITCPVKRKPLGSPILDITINDIQPWRTKLLRTLEANYGRAPNYAGALSLLRPLIQQPEANLARFNIAVIKAVAAHLGLSARFVRQSSLSYSGKATQLLISLVKAVNGTAYLAGGGASGYQQDDLFREHRINLVYQNFEPKPYRDVEKFIPGLSVIDYLMHDGRSLAHRC